MKRAIILIDGSNFYFKLKDLHFTNLLSFDFSGFKKLIGDQYSLEKSTYYVGAVKDIHTHKSQLMFTYQRKLFALLKNHGFNYSLGYLLKSGGKFHEKGVDVNIAVDILVAVYEHHADHIFLVSSDTDLIPAIRKAKEKGVTVEYVGFSHKPSRAMMKNCSNYRLLTQKQIMPLIS